MIASMSDANKKLVRRVTEEMLMGNSGLASELFAAPLVERQIGLADMLRGAFPDLTLKVEVLIAEDDMVACHWSAKGTQRGDVMGIAPTNAEASWTGTSIYQIADEKVVSVQTNWDVFELIQQLHDAAKQQAPST